MRFRLPIFRFVAVIGLAASSASLADQALGHGSFCSFESGCEAVTSSAYGKPLGIPLPTLGLAGFAAVLGFTLIGRERVSRRLAHLAALIGLALIVVQFAVLHRVCPLCLVADAAAMGLGLLAIAPLPALPARAISRATWFVLAVLAVLVPLAIGLLDEAPDPPDWIQSHWVEGKITVVEVTDFECEHCRKADEYLRDALKTRSDVNFARIPVPMPKHANSRPAALAFHAAKAQGRGEPMAVALFAAASRTPADCRGLAEKLGLNLLEYDRVVADPATDDRVRVATAAAKAAGPGVPLIWIQSHLIYGSPTPDNFDGPLRRAKPYHAK